VLDTGASQPCKGLSWTYDPWGNRSNQTVTAGTCDTFQASVTANNQLNDPVNNIYQYDAAGNMTYDGNHHYAYDAESRISSVDVGATAIYVYDANGRRVAKGVTNSLNTFYLHGPDGQVRSERDGNNNWIQTYIYFGGQSIGLYRGTHTGFNFRDHLGSTRLVTLGNQCVFDVMDFLPFGEQIAGATATSHKFTGKERDSESGLDNFGARYDSSSMGRFMSPDPKILSIRHIINPQKWNKYAYTINNPLRYFDPNGMEEIEVQLRAVIQAQTRSDPVGSRFAGDNRGFTSAQNVTSRTSITVRIETDASKRPGNPIISVTQPGTAGQTKQVDANGNVIKTGTATTGLPTVTGSRDASGNAVLNFQENAKNPLEPQSVTPGIRADLNVTVTQNGLSADVAGTVSGAPSFELNVGSTNIPLQTEPSSDMGFGLGLFQTNSIQISTPLSPPPPPPPCATDKEKPCQ
jgi:RHS repeat-associated protein